MTSNFNCRICNITFESEYKLKNHKRKEHQVECVVGGQTVPKFEGFFKCPNCPKKVANPDYLRKHFKVHLNDNVQRQVEILSAAAINEEPDDITNDSAGLFCSLALMEMGMKYNMKYSILICSACNIGLEKSEKYLVNHFNNKCHAKKKVCLNPKNLVASRFLKIRKIWLRGDF